MSSVAKNVASVAALPAASLTLAATRTESPLLVPALPRLLVVNVHVHAVPETVVVIEAEPYSQVTVSVFAPKAVPTIVNPLVFFSALLT